MIGWPTYEQILKIHESLIQQSGGSMGIRDSGAIQSSLAQPLQSFGGQDLYPSLADKAAALAFFLISNHPFVDGNKRVGYAAAQVFLKQNGFKIAGSVDEKEHVVLAVAAGEMKHPAFRDWLNNHLAPLTRSHGGSLPS